MNTVIGQICQPSLFQLFYFLISIKLAIKLTHW